MNELKLGGSISSALTHFTMYGLSAILEDAGFRPVRFWWTDELEPTAMLSVEAGWDEVSTAVQAHAARLVADDSWLLKRSDVVKERPVFSPRAKAPEPDTWRAYLDERRRWAPSKYLDSQFIHALGQPAWWVEKNADAGASRWEMKTRNRGSEIVLDRLVPLGRAVRARSPEQIVSGLRGDTVSDEAGSDSPTSRSATGFTTPGPTDNAVAWCALWGIVVALPLPVVGGVSDTPGVWERRRTHPTKAVLPVWIKPASVRLVRSVLSDAALVGAAMSDDASVDRGRLRDLGVAALVKFPIHKGGSTSAPERMLLTGELVPLLVGHDER